MIFKSNGKINTVLICENDCNYHGECIDVNKCLCNEGWTGVYCQYEIMQSEDEERASLCLNAKYINHSYDVANGCYDRCRDPDFSVYNISYGIYFDSDVIIPNIYPNQYVFYNYCIYLLYKPKFCLECVCVVEISLLFIFNKFILSNGN